MNNKLKKLLVERIDYAIQQSLNEFNIDYQKFGNINQDKVLQDIKKPIGYKDKDIYNTVQNTLDNMHKQYKFKDVLNNFATKVDFSPNIPTAETNQDRMLIFNPDFARKLYAIDLKALELIILHEAMHNYMRDKGRQQPVNSVDDNVRADQLVNHEIFTRWPEYKQYRDQLGMFYY